MVKLPRMCARANNRSDEMSLSAMKELTKGETIDEIAPAARIVPTCPPENSRYRGRYREKLGIILPNAKKCRKVIRDNFLAKELLIWLLDESYKF